jgi:hypothetical protein
MTRWAIALLVGCALVPSPGAQDQAQAQEQSQDIDETDQRFVFHEVDEGILRLDTKLGEISLCSRQSVGWTCRTVPDERKALDTEITRLQQENAELKNALSTHGEHDGKAALGTTGGIARPDAARPEGAKPDALAKTPEAARPAEPAKPSGDLRRVREVVGMIWSRLVEMMAHLRADLAKST